MLRMMRTHRSYGHILADALRDLGTDTRVVEIRADDEDADEEALGHIPGAEVLSIEGLAKAAAGWDPDQPVLVVCQRGSRSIYGAALLTSMGFRRVGSLVGGMLAYRDAGLPVAAG